MLRLLSGLAGPLMAAGLALLVLPRPGSAAGKIDVNFETFDRVTLRGTFYSPAGGARSPCVILVHKFGGSRQQPGWEDLAKALQKEDYAVLSFDLRGHGESTKVDPLTFWRVTANSSHVKGANFKKDKISYKEFGRDYVPWLAHDIDAARLFLDQQNNSHLCNSSNMFVIGAEDGAAIAALWICAQRLLPSYQRDAFGRLLPIGPPGGDTISGAVWLSIPSSLAHQSLTSWFRSTIPGTKSTLGEKVPMDFVYGKGDTQAASAARSLMDALRVRGRRTLSATCPKEGKLAGADLLGKDALKTEEDVVKYMAAVLEKKNTSWTQRDANPLAQIPLSEFGYWLR